MELELEFSFPPDVNENEVDEFAEAAGNLWRMFVEDRHGKYVMAKGVIDLVQLWPESRRGAKA